MFRQFRSIHSGEHIVVGGDTSQGGSDECFIQFLSKTKLDIPLVYQRRGVAAQMTADLFPVLERLHDLTGLSPTVAIERQNGGASEMERLNALNRLAKYELFVMPKIGQELLPDDDRDTKKLGWDTTVATRPMMLGDLKHAIASKAFAIYDAVTLQQLFAFIVNSQGKPEAAPGKRDDAVMSLAITWQLFQRVETPVRFPAEPSSPTSFDKYGLFAGMN